MEKVTSYQVGMEAQTQRYVALKATLFRHEVTDGITPEQLPDGTFTQINKSKIRREGIEVEARTEPIYNTTLSLGYTYNNVTDRETGRRIAWSPKFSIDGGLFYRTLSFRALLRGHFIKWAADEYFTGKNGKTVFDLTLEKTVLRKSGMKADLFFSVHNIFDTPQYLVSVQPNAGRWIEGGLKVVFF